MRSRSSRERGHPVRIERAARTRPPILAHKFPLIMRESGLGARESPFIVRESTFRARESPFIARETATIERETPLPRA